MNAKEIHRHITEHLDRPNPGFHPGQVLVAIEKAFGMKLPEIGTRGIFVRYQMSQGDQTTGSYQVASDLGDCLVAMRGPSGDEWHIYWVHSGYFRPATAEETADLLD